MCDGDDDCVMMMVMMNVWVSDGEMMVLWWECEMLWCENCVLWYVCVWVMVCVMVLMMWRVCEEMCVDVLMVMCDDGDDVWVFERIVVFEVWLKMVCEEMCVLEDWEKEFRGVFGKVEVIVDVEVEEKLVLWKWLMEMFGECVVLKVECEM